MGSHSEASSAQCRLTRPWRLQTTVPSREPGRRARPRFLALVSMRLWPDLDSAFYNICCPLRFCLRSWRMSCAQWTLAWPEPRATPQQARGTEQPFFLPAPAGPEGTFVFRQSLSGSRHPPVPPQTQVRPRRGPGTDHLAGSLNASRQAEHRGWTPSPPAGLDWAPLPEPQHLHRPGDFTRWGEWGPKPEESEEKRGRGPCPAPCSHGNLQRSGVSSAFWEAGLRGALFPLHPETPTTPRFARLPIASLASRWRSWQRVPGSAYPSPRALHPNSALAVEGLRVQHFVFPGGAQNQLGGTSAVPIPQGLSTLRMALFLPTAGRSTYRACPDACFPHLLLWFMHQGCQSIWQTILLNQLG